VIHTDILASARGMYKSAVSYIYAHVRDLVFAGSGKKDEITFQKVIPPNRAACFVLLPG
jgi:hypothetical protein